MGADEVTKEIAEAKKKAGNEAFAKKDYDEALRLYSEAIHLDPSNYIYHSNRSACHALKGEHSKAKKDAEECIRLNPDFVKGYYRLATAQTDLGDVVAAIATVDVGLGRDPKNGDLLRLKRTLKAKKATLAQRAGSSGKGSRSASDRAEGGGQVDAQTIQEFQELSEQVGQTKRDLAEVEAQLQTCVREQKRGVLTRGELDSIGDSCTMYQTVGKMFMARSRAEITEILENQQADRSKLETQLQGKQSYLRSRMTSQEGNLEEIIKNIQAQGSS